MTMKILYIVFVLINCRIASSTGITLQISINFDACNICGPNTECKNMTCICLPGFYSTSYGSCRPECSSNHQCREDKACQKKQCQNPCNGTCGINAMCTVINHQPVCTCLPGYTGNPFTSCGPILDLAFPNTCYPSPCGPNSRCKTNGDAAICACIEGYQGRPPNCRAQCVDDSECPSTKACIRQECVDPCGICGTSAHCDTLGHNPVCTCKAGQTGDPYLSCHDNGTIPDLESCNSTSCGPYSQCSKNRCVSLCSICGVNAQCGISSKAVGCRCRNNFYGNPLVKCVRQKENFNNHWILWCIGVLTPIALAIIVIAIYCIINDKENKHMKQSSNATVNYADRGQLPLPPMIQTCSVITPSIRVYRSRVCSVENAPSSIPHSSKDQIFEEADDPEFKSFISPMELRNIVKNLRNK